MSEPNQPQPQTMTFRIVKGADFRQINATGIMIQQSPRAHSARISFVSDRVPYEEKLVFGLEPTPDGKSGVLKKRIDKPGDEIDIDTVEREVQIEINVNDVDLQEIHRELTRYMRWRGLLVPAPKPAAPEPEQA